MPVIQYGRVPAPEVELLFLINEVGAYSGIDKNRVNN